MKCMVAFKINDIPDTPAHSCRTLTTGTILKFLNYPILLKNYNAKPVQTLTQG